VITEEENPVITESNADTAFQLILIGESIGRDTSPTGSQYKHHAGVFHPTYISRAQFLVHEEGFLDFFQGPVI